MVLFKLMKNVESTQGEYGHAQVLYANAAREDNEELIFVAVMHGSSRVDPDHSPIRS